MPIGVAYYVKPLNIGVQLGGIIINRLNGILMVASEYNLRLCSPISTSKELEIARTFGGSGALYYA